jgi:transcription initiation factor TFIID subunit 2
MFSFNRKRNIVEIELKQDMLNQRGYRKYTGPLSLTIQELDGSFTHTIQIEENTTRFDLACHSKLRRNKKKKIPLSNGEEVDIDLSQYDTDTSILWIRIDPDIRLLREIKFEQPDHHWQNQLKYERDVISQIESIDTLVRFPSPNTRTILASIIDNYDIYYQVRIHATHAIADVANKMIHTWNGPLALVSSFKKMFMSHACPNIVKYNNFGDLQQYFLQKQMPIAMGSLRNVHNVCPNEIIRFLLDLLRFNENSKNRYSDSYYKAALIDALGSTVTYTAYAANTQDIKSANLTHELRLVIEEIVLKLNLEKLVPSHRYVITCACLNAMRNLQILGHVPENINIFKQYTQYHVFEDVRKVAFEIIIKCLQGWRILARVRYQERS